MSIHTPPAGAVFRGRMLPWLLLAPQLAVLVLFFFRPAAEGLRQAFHLADPFTGRGIYVGLDNFRALFAEPEYLDSIRASLIFAGLVAGIAMALAFVLAAAADRLLGERPVLRSAIIWPYAVAPAVAGVLWLFLLHPSFGVIAQLLHEAGLAWNPLLDGTDAMALIVAAAVWKQISYNFIFFFAAIRSVPKSLIEAAAIDGAGPLRRLRDVVWPLVSPTSFFLLVMNLIYAFFDSFGIVDAITKGGPGGATRLMVYKAYRDGFQAQDLGGSAAQSIVLMALVGVLTVIQFGWIERKVSYARS